MIEFTIIYKAGASTETVIRKTLKGAMEFAHRVESEDNFHYVTVEKFEDDKTTVIYNKNKRGGKRKGAGRPPSLEGPGKPVTVWLTTNDTACLSKLGKGNVSAGIRKLIQIVNETPS